MYIERSNLLFLLGLTKFPPIENSVFHCFQITSCSSKMSTDLSYLIPELVFKMPEARQTIDDLLRSPVHSRNGVLQRILVGFSGDHQDAYGFLKSLGHGALPSKVIEFCKANTNLSGPEFDTFRDNLAAYGLEALISLLRFFKAFLIRAEIIKVIFDRPQLGLGVHLNALVPSMTPETALLVFNTACSCFFVVESASEIAAADTHAGSPDGSHGVDADEDSDVEPESGFFKGDPC